MTPNLTPEQSHAVKVWTTLGTLELIQDQGGNFPQAPSGYAATLFAAEVVKLSGTCGELSANLTEARAELRNLRNAIHSLIDGHSEFLGLSTRAQFELRQIATQGHKSPNA